MSHLITQKGMGFSTRGAYDLFNLQSKKLTLRVLLPALCPPLLHGVGDTLPALGAQLAFARRCGSGILAALWAASARASSRLSRPGQQRARLLQLRYLGINLGNNTVYFHVLPPVGVDRFKRSSLHK
jgi:hypothetical protein